MAIGKDTKRRTPRPADDPDWTMAGTVTLTTTLQDELSGYPDWLRARVRRVDLSPDGRNARLYLRRPESGAR